jgi:hypothetical protein
MGRACRMQGRLLVGKPEEKRLVTRPTCKSEDNIKMDLKEKE